MNILIVKLGAIGDIIHTLPALSAIRKALPDARVAWIAEARSAGILKGNLLIDDLIEIDTKAVRRRAFSREGLPGATRQFRLLRSYGIDVAVDFQGLLKSAVIAKLSKARRRWGFDGSSLREPAARVMYTDVAAVPASLHVIHRNLELASAAFQLVPGNEPPEFPIYTDESDRAEAVDIALQAGERFAILNPAGGWVTKLWSAENFGALAKRIYRELGLRSVVAVGPREVELAERTRVAAGADARPVVVQPSLKGFFELAKLGAVYVGGDTGPTHLAIAANAPVVGLFGPTEWWRNGSLAADDICVERSDIGCRTECNRRSCTNWICMDISVETVFEAVRSRVEKTVNAPFW